jgi:hypothetical protein
VTADRGAGEEVRKAVKLVDKASEVAGGIAAAGPLLARLSTA